MYEKGDAEAYAAAYADNAAFTPPLQPFRVDGKAAIKPNISAHHTALHRSKRWPLGSVRGSGRIDTARVMMPIEHTSR